MARQATTVTDWIIVISVLVAWLGEFPGVLGEWSGGFTRARGNGLAQYPNQRLAGGECHEGREGGGKRETGRQGLIGVGKAQVFAG